MSVERIARDVFERRAMPLMTPLPVRRNRSLQATPSRTTDPRLTPRQLQVLDGVMRGLTNKEIAAELGVGPDAVKRIVSRLLVRLEAPSRTALVQVALRTSAARLARSGGPNPLTLLDVAPIPAIVTRGDRHVVEYVNAAGRAALPMLEVDAPLADALPPLAHAAVGALLRAAYSAEASRTVRAVRLAASGTSWSRADFFASPLRDGAERVAGLIVFLVEAPDAQPGGARARSGTSRVEVPERDLAGRDRTPIVVS